MTMRHLRWAAVAGLLSSSAAWAAGPDSFAYDALGRLVKVERQGPSTTVSSTYAYDAAGNRTQVVVTDQLPARSPPSFTIGNASATEGGVLQFTVTRSILDAYSYSVNFTTVAVTAQPGSDYVAVSGTLDFAPTTASQVIQVATVDNTIAEGTETFTVLLSSPGNGATLGNAQGTGTITDNDSSGGGGSGGEGCYLIQDATGDSGTQVAPLVQPVC